MPSLPALPTRPSVQYRLKKRLASSICGEIMLAEDTHNYNQLVVCKISQQILMDKARSEDPEAELAVLERLAHNTHNNSIETEGSQSIGSNAIVKFLNRAEEGTSQWCVLEFCEGGDLFEKVKNTFGQGNTLQEAPKFFYQVAHGLQYLHDRDIVHRDLSLENILITGEGNCKIADFGMAQSVECIDGVQKVLYNTGIKSRPGKLGYLAPEVVELLPYNGKSADVFALGVCLFQMLAGVPPFRSASKKDTCWKFIRLGKFGKLIKGWRLENHISTQAQDLLEGMFAPEEKRLTISQVLQHPFFLQCANTT